MTARATGLGSPRNGMAEWKPYRWHGKPPTVPAPIERPKKSWNPGARQERLEALARMRINDTPGRNLDRLPRDVLTHEQAARMFGVTKRTILRDLEALQAKREAS